MKVVRVASFCFLILIGSASNAVDIGQIYGQWVVRDVFCRTCTAIDKADIGIIVTMLADRAQNPLAGGQCQGLTAYRGISVKGERRAAIVQKLNPKWIARAEDLELLSVTCNGIDFMLYVVLSRDALVYVDDGAIVYKLSKQQ